MGKGSNRRQSNEAAYAANYDAIFTNKEKVTTATGPNFWDAETQQFYKWSEMEVLRKEREVQPEESAEDRFERHMAPIREAQRKAERNVPTAQCFNYSDE